MIAMGSAHLWQVPSCSTKTTQTSSTPCRASAPAPHTPHARGAYPHERHTALEPTRHEHPGRQRDDGYYAHETSRRASRPFFATVGTVFDDPELFDLRIATTVIVIVVVARNVNDSQKEVSSSASLASPPPRSGMGFLNLLHSERTDSSLVAPHGRRWRAMRRSISESGVAISLR